MKKYLIAALLIASASSFAQDAYVTDKFTVAVRSGEAADYRILRMLRTGTKVEVISQNRETGYSKIRFNNGKEGFVLTRQLLDEPTARDRLADLEKEMAPSVPAARERSARHRRSHRAHRPEAAPSWSG